MNETVPMSETELEIRNWLSPESVKSFDDMYYCRVLGAGNNIRMIADMYSDLSVTARCNGLNTQELLRRVAAVNQYFIQKRGSSSYAIIAAIHHMTGQLQSLADHPLEDVCAALNDAYSNYTATSELWMQSIKAYIWNVICTMDCVLLFDYSGTVNSVLQVAHDHGKKLRVFIPESRILDGGHAYVRSGISLGHTVHYFPDAALAHFIEKADAAFFGAETFFPSGSVANTVGSDITAILCHYYRKPLYVPTQLIKVDPRGFTGCGKQVLFEDASPYFGLQLEQPLRDAADMRIAGLVTVPAQLITAFITEEGVVPPSAMYQVSKQFINRMESCS